MAVGAACKQRALNNQAAAPLRLATPKIILQSGGQHENSSAITCATIKAGMYVIYYRQDILALVFGEGQLISACLEPCSEQLLSQRSRLLHLRFKEV